METNNYLILKNIFFKLHKKIIIFKNTQHKHNHLNKT
jgi:hypothetical protein